MDAITVQQLRKRYGEVHALDGLTFAVREGEVFGLRDLDVRVVPALDLAKR